MATIQIINELKDDYKNDVFSGNRKYTITTGSDGKSTIVDATTYTTEGDMIGASVFNSIASAINKLNTIVTIELPAGSWGESAPYSQTIRNIVDGSGAAVITADSNPIFFLEPKESVVTQDELESYAYIGELSTGNASVTVVCPSDKPTTTLKIRMKGI